MAEPIRLVVGLGNPGREYALTRHNAGFWWVERLASLLRCDLHQESRFHGLIGRVSGSDARLLLPQIFMNRSGQAVAAVSQFFQIPSEAILVVHDELDLKPGEVKLRLGGSATHNGLRDIISRMGSPQFWRLKIGISHPRDEKLEQGVIDYVLRPPRHEERTAIDSAIDKSLAIWPRLDKGELERAMLELHTKPRPEVKTNGS